MEWTVILTTIFEVCIIPILAVLTGAFVVWVKAKSKALQSQMDSELGAKYVAMFEKTVINCVIATNQTYVDSLKQSGKFDEEAQKEAFKRTSDAVLALLTDEAKLYLSTIYGDLELQLTKQIEAEVNRNK